MNLPWSNISIKEVQQGNADSPANYEAIKITRLNGSSGAATANRASWITFKDGDNPTYIGGIQCRRNAAAVNFVSDMLFYVNATGSAVISDFSTLSLSMTLNSNGGVTWPATNTAAGTTGDQTINKTSGTVNFAAAASTITVTNSLVTTASIIFGVIRTADATAVSIKSIVPGSGSFVITLGAAATAETSVGFFVIN